jgi:SAM-dependent methyltransferase
MPDLHFEVFARAMRDVVTGFYCEVLRKLMAAEKISISDSVLIVCGGPLDESVMREVGFPNVKLTNIDGVEETQDAENLSYADGSFDVVVVHAGLHHCHSPHRALLETYRVARKAAIAFESRDSLLMRIAVKLGFTMDYGDRLRHGRWEGRSGRVGYSQLRVSVDGARGLESHCDVRSGPQTAHRVLLRHADSDPAADEIGQPHDASSWDAC